MALKVLLADDNITAQRMGSKILIDAGYTVVAVSNGAAAVKKIAAERPDLAILDVFMPGYSGLEVCEKIKNAAETARMTVLLTVTNMEPYSPADGNRVKADGVLIKPFEATDLLAVMHKFEEKLQAQARAVDRQAREEKKEEAESEAEATDSVSKPVEMSQEMASAPALGIEELESPAAEAAPVSVTAPAVWASVAAPVSEPEPVVEAAAAEAAPVFEMPVAQAEPVAEAPVAEEAAPEFVIETPALGEAALEMAPPGVAEAAVEVPAVGEAMAEFAVVAPEPAAEIAPDAEEEFQSAPDVAPVELAPATEDEEGQAYGVGMGQEPMPEDFDEFATKFHAEHEEDIPVGIAVEQNSAEALEAIPELLVEPIDAAEEPSAEVADSASVTEVAEALPPADETFDVREPVVEPEPEPEPEYDTQRVHGAVEELEYETLHIHLVDSPAGAIKEIHDAAVAVEQQEQELPAPAVAAEPEHEAPPVAASVELEPQELELVAAVEAPAIGEQQPEPETAIAVEAAEENEQAPAVVEEPEREMPQVSVVVEEPEHPAHEIPVAEEAEAAPFVPEAPVAVTEVPSVLEAQVAGELERVQAEMVAAEPQIEPEMEPPAQAAAAPAYTMNEERVAEAVHRVLDRYKGELIAAIVSELRK